MHFSTCSFIVDSILVKFHIGWKFKRSELKGQCSIFALMPWWPKIGSLCHVRSNHPYVVDVQRLQDSVHAIVDWRSGRNMSQAQLDRIGW